MSNERNAFRAGYERMYDTCPRGYIVETGEYTNDHAAHAWLWFKKGAEWQRSQQSAPAGYVMVPVEPTPEMLDCIMDWQKIGNVTAYRAMLAAAPKAEQPPVQEPFLDSYDEIHQIAFELGGTDGAAFIALAENICEWIAAAPQPVAQEPDIEQIMVKAKELFGWYAGLGGFDDAVRELVAFTAGHRFAPSAPVEPVANQLIKGMADALRHALKELDTETPEDIDYGQLYSALSAYEAFKVEPAHSDDARDALVEALDALIADYDGEIHNEYGGTSMLDSRLSEINYAREALATYRAAQEKK